MAGMAMNGIGMLLKSFGLNPETIKQYVENGASEMKKVIEHFDSRFNKTDKRMEEIQASLLRLEEKLGTLPVSAEIIPIKTQAEN